MMQWLRKHWMHLVAFLLSSRKSSIGCGAIKPAPKPALKPKVTPRSRLRKMRSLLLSLTLLTLSFSGCSTKPLPVDTNPDRPCYQWVITKDQEVYVYENGSLIARLETEPYDAVISGWCVMRNNEHFMNDIRRLSQ
jgi:hypothetical protein